VRVVSVQVGAVARRGSMRTAFGKHPVQGLVRVLVNGLEGDAQAFCHHGGPEMAVLAYAARHYPLWRKELSWPELPLGGFAENLTVEGASEETVCISDVWSVGTAVLQVAAPRTPCRKLSRFWSRPGLRKAVEESGRLGWYLRVLQEGALQAGDEIELLRRGEIPLLQAWRKA
jgi:MOSC domain-containing protein YiiM